MNRHGITGRMLLVVGLAALVVGYLVAVVVIRDGSLLQRPPWGAGVLLVVMGGLVLGLARPVRKHLHSGARTSLDALRAARTVVLSQAAALTGAAAAGWYLGQLGGLLGDLSLVANQERLLPFGLLLLASVVLMVCGMVAQSWCRIDRDDEPTETEDD
ncbi:DUF3180 domain-containing protein [Phycicoccus sp. CSK15P-2]|uniref:DUF3180 domain-containing protein n=1 Tax=Phycicoccus sp. CSK15P-2 TaxID=2807627 RepID=UPI00194FBF80|nr:DUF3180 domain-containing protein [Phycicoccus sp. CSK15P-2]MBM6405561.1 DUF3180 domain-containing protein [Phycicoccus sp. CSK15P-2]